ncbi:MAG: hypothetical protein HKN29_00250, partial [Rhodothermales bacterium]|nr:hypothetical protein [Rhodothermales bacterium]
MYSPINRRVFFAGVLFSLLTLPAQAQQPAFSIDPGDSFFQEGAKLCMPPLMVLGAPSATHTWWARSTGGDLELTLHAISVDVDREDGTATMAVSGPSGSGSVSVAYPLTAGGAEDTGVVTIPGTNAGDEYRIDVTIAAGDSLQTASHYRITAVGADLLGTATELAEQAEHNVSSWVIGAQGESSLSVTMNVTTT